MGLHGVTQLIDAFDGSIGSGVKTDTVIGAADVVVDGSRNADDIDAIFAQRQSATESAVTADGDNAVESQELAGRNSFSLTLFGHEFFTACSVKDGTATINGVGNTVFV